MTHNFMPKDISYSHHTQNAWADFYGFVNLEVVQGRISRTGIRIDAPHGYHCYGLGSMGSDAWVGKKGQLKD